MRLSELGLLFAMLFLCLLVMDDLRTDRLTAQTEQKIQYNNALDNAVEAALMEGVERDNGKEIKVNRKELWDKFLTAMYVNFDAMESPDKQILLENCIPLAAIVEKDRVSFTSKRDGRRFFQAFYFRETYENYTVDYTLSDYVYVRNHADGEWLEGDYHDVSLLYPVPIFLNGGFEQERRNVIISVITEHMEKLVEEYNVYAKSAGIQYHFSFPRIPEEEWYRTVDDVSLLVLFQGFPYQDIHLGFYNKAAFGGARLRKENEECKYPG